MTSSPSRFRRVWGVPIFLAILTIGGLVSALLGDGIWNVLSWLALTGPLAAIFWIFARRDGTGGR